MTNEIRIPNLPMGNIVEKDGYPTDDEMTFRQVLISNLQRLFGNNGVVLPSLTSTEIAYVENKVDIQGRKTCAYGTMVYDTTVNQVKVAINIGGNPVFKVIPYTP
jgi:hypothetical protein